MPNVSLLSLHLFLTECGWLLGMEAHHHRTYLQQSAAKGVW